VDVLNFFKILHFALEKLRQHVASGQWSLSTNLGLIQSKQIIASVDNLLSLIHPSHFKDGLSYGCFDHIVEYLSACDVSHVLSTGVLSQVVKPSSICPTLGLFSFNFVGGILQNVSRETTEHFYIALFSILLLVSGSYHSEVHGSRPIVTTNHAVTVTVANESLVEFLCC
jgi:hypothetical protein